MFYLKFLLVFFCIFPQKPKKQMLPVKGYTLVWSDEFSGRQLNLKKWNHRGLGKRDESYVTEQSVKLDGNGHLVMEVKTSNDSVLTGMISTENTFKMKYGYFECRAKFAATPGTISAFWLQSQTITAANSSPDKNGAELDIFEYFPHLNKDHVAHTIHYGGYGAGHKVGGPEWGKLSTTSDDFHTVGLEWTDTSYATFVDGVKTFSGNQLISHMPEFIVLSLGVNQQAAGPLSVKDLPDRFIVDYVRVYARRSVE
jgi:beta-glucanase (GH16 family)